jgi:hypothetical protein
MAAKKKKPAAKKKAAAKPHSISRERAERQEIEELQRAMNAYVKKARLGFSPLRVDGDDGPATSSRARHLKFLLGYLHENYDEIGRKELLRRLRHPNQVGGPYHVTKHAVKRGKERRRARRVAVAKNRIKGLFKPGVGSFDGHPVARPFIPRLQWAREHGWKGYLVSGWRDPAYSESLCYSMCGAPSCPGRCAGRSSRHSQITIEGGAIDVSDYANFGQLMTRCPYNPKIKNALGVRDPVHFSVAGN